MDKAPSSGPFVRAQGLAAMRWDHKPQPGQRAGLYTTLLCISPSSTSLPGTLFGFPVLTSIRVNWGALKKDTGCSIAEGSIYHIAVSSDPADIGHTAEDISWLVVKHKLQKQKRLSEAYDPTFPHVTESVL